MPSVFPQELVDIVIDQLHDDIPSLKAFALSFRAAVASAQIHIFHKVILASPRQSGGGLVHSPVQRLCRLLASSSHLAPLIKDLRIIEDGPGQWVSKSSRALSTLLPLLGLKQLKAALQTVFRSPGLEFVQLCGIYIGNPSHFPLFHILRDAPASLTTLAVSYSAPRENVSAHVIPPSWLPRLQSLAIEFNAWDDHIPRSLSNPVVDLSRLQSLSLSCVGISEIRLLIDTMVEGGSVLQDLNIWFVRGLSSPFGIGHANVYSFAGDPYLPHTGLALLSSLRSARFTVIRGATEAEDLINIVNDCAANPSLQLVVLDVGLAIFLQDAVEQWADIAAAVASGGKVTDILFTNHVGALPINAYHNYIQRAIQAAKQGVESIDTKGLLTLKES
ncbi:hypothetical protein C8J57DRAFT_1506265 [Mycena rebaudengoi]|nr:hypothetical protein C8J57DRAFT_1506265 [Mycena rebaudengoi]